MKPTVKIEGQDGVEHDAKPEKKTSSKKMPTQNEDSKKKKKRLSNQHLFESKFKMANENFR